MKWIKEKQTYLYPNWISEDGKYKAYSKDIQTARSLKLVWMLEIDNNVIYTGKTFKSCKEFAENHRQEKRNENENIKYK